MRTEYRNDRGRYEMNEKREVAWEHFDRLPSTNDYAKSKRADGQALIVTASCQSGGRGTKGRAFSSNEGGVYLSKLTFYKELAAKDAFTIMASAAVSVCETLRFYGLQPVIKWVNDIYVNDKKICGILIENVFSGNFVSSSVVGIGLNVNNVLPDELSAIATTMRLQTGKTFSVAEVTKRLIEELEKGHSMKEYLSYIGYMGREATLIFGDKRIHGTLLSVDGEGGLLVEIQGEKRRLLAAEVSIKI